SDAVGRLRDRVRVRDRVGQVQQSEPSAVEIERGTPVFEPNVRRAGARPGRWDIEAMIEFRRRGSVADADRRVFIAVAELDAGGVVLKLLGARAHDRRAGLFSKLLPFFAVFFDSR